MPARNDLVNHSDRSHRHAITAPQNFQNGFTLIEILVSLVILGLALGVISAGLNTASRGIENTEEQTKALVIAKSLLATEASATSLHYGDTSGVTDDFYDWQISIKPFGSPADIAARAAGAYLVTVSVTNDDKTLTLSTLRAGPIANAN